MNAELPARRRGARHRVGRRVDARHHDLAELERQLVAFVQLGHRDQQQEREIDEREQPDRGVVRGSFRRHAGIQRVDGTRDSESAHTGKGTVRR